MKTKLFAAVLGIVSLVCSVNFAFASQIPGGYVLVPAEAFFGSQPLAVAPAARAEVSTTKSSLRVNDEIGYVGEQYSLATVTLRDTENRPLAGINVHLISSRATDSIENLQATTNSNGEAVFRIIANEEGVSGLTAIAANTTLAERPRIVFLEQAGGIGGSLLRAEILAEDEMETPAAANEPVFVNQLKITFPEEAEKSRPSDITITVENTDGEIVDDYLGTIEFESSDALAILPQSYTFVELDRGVHTFANAVTFGTIGEQTITISGGADIGSQEIVVNVSDGSGSTGGVAKPIISQPLDGEILNDAVTLSGLGPTNTNIVIFVNGQFFQNTESDANGNFLTEVVLSDGAHEITAGVLRDDSSVGSVSEAVTVTIDQTTPRVEEISLSPGNKVVVGDTVGVEVKSEANLKSALFRINDDVVDLSESVELGTYVGEFIATDEGAYFAEVELEDIAGNIGSYPEATSVLIETAITIQDIETTSHDGRIDLRWSAPANSSKVANYEIFYGTSEDALTKKFTTSDNRTAWFIDELNNNTMYFFRVVSLNTLGKQNGGSDVVSAIPAASFFAKGCNARVSLSWKTGDAGVASYRLDYGLASGDYSESRLLPDGRSRNEWEVRDLINGTEYFFALRGVDDFGSVVANLGEASARPQASAICESGDPIQLFQRKNADGSTILMWNPVPGATSYRVHAGTYPNVYNLATVEVESTAFQPTGLLANEDYYFAVSAVFSGGHNAATLSNALKVEVGPAEILLISIFAALTGSFLWRRKLRGLTLSVFD